MEKKKFFSARNIAYFAVLLALEVVLLFFGAAIPVGAGGASLNFSLIPVVLGALLLGPVAGAFLGFLAGFVILMMVIGGMQGPVFLYLLNYSGFSGFMIVVVCLLKTTLAGFVSGILYRVLVKKNSWVAVFVASFAAPVVNTGVFILGCLCMSNAVSVAATEYPAINVGSAFFIIILVFVTYNFFIELALNLVLAPAIHTIVKVVEKRTGKKKSVTGEQAQEQDAPTEDSPEAAPQERAPEIVAPQEEIGE